MWNQIKVLFDSITPAVAIWITVGSFLVSIGGIFAAGWVVVRLPADHFEHKNDPLSGQHPVLWVILLIIRNLIGIVLILVGIAMLVLPGQGILTILLGVSIAYFPGRRKLTQWLLHNQRVRRSLNWLRRKAHKEPFSWSD